MRSFSKRVDPPPRLANRLCLLVVAGALLPTGRASAQPRPFQSALERAVPRVLKLYGARAGGEAGYGSAVVVSPDGKAVTTLSLLLEARDLRAVAADGRVSRPEVVARDPARQLALLQLPAKDLPYFDLQASSSADVQPGDFVFAIGNPFRVAEGREPVSVSFGVVSARTRLEARDLAQDFPYRGEVLLLDVITANPGAAGGAVVDLDGRLVGLVGEIVTSRRSNTRLNYCMPVEVVAEFVRHASAPDYQPATQPADHPPGYHGIKLFTLGFRRSAAYVDRVVPDSPAARAGLQSDDLILSVEGEAVRDSRSFERRMRQFTAGQRVRLVIKRGQEARTLELVLEEPP